jgi:hypothetical protein
MPITFTSGLTPTFPENSFSSEKEHVRLISTSLTNNNAFINPLAGALTTMLARVDAVKILLQADNSVAASEILTLEGYASSLPTGWANAGFISSDFSNIVSAINSYMTANTALQAKLTTFKDYFIVSDIDNFKLHNELLCGLDDAPPAGIIKPNLNALMGLCRSINDIENRFGITFTNYLLGLFGTLFTGDTTIANAQSHVDTIPTSYASLDIVTVVSADPFTTTPSALISSINSLESLANTYGTTVDTHKDNFTTHITDDMAYYHLVVDKLEQYIQAYSISGHIQDPYYAFMYTDVFGSTTINNVITQFQNGDIQ